MKSIHIKIAGLSERDTDLLLLEEFTSSPEFVGFFLGKIGLDSDENTFFKASRSVTDSTGESDLEVILNTKNGSKFMLMLENKVNAVFQPKQADRYRERGSNYRRDGKIDDFTTILVAPGGYFSGDKRGFDHRVDYEALRGWFECSRLEAGRKHYKISVLTSAIEKRSRGCAVDDASASCFWRDYWLLAMDLAPEFSMAEPPNKPSGATFIHFNQAGLPQDVTLIHKLKHGRFDLQFSGMGEKMTEMNSRYQQKLLPKMKIVKAGKAASIRICVPKIAVGRSLEDQKDVTIEAIQSGKELLSWWKKHISTTHDTPAFSRFQTT